MDSLIHGDKYEHYVKLFLTNKYKNIWLWNEIPINILHNLNIIPVTQTVCDDIGCDILAETDDNNYHFIQCKNYSTIGIDNTINICDLSGFYNFMAENKLSNGIVYYSGCLSSQVIKRSKAIKYVNLPYNTCDSITLTPYAYQIDAINKLSCPGRNTLTMPCGTGKTYVSYLLSTGYKNVIVLSPLISTAEQLYSFYKQYYQNTETCNISIFNCKTKSINKIVDLQKQNVIVSTYDSVNLIYNNVSQLTNKIIIIDEYHNLSNNNLTNTNDSIYKLLNFNDTTYLFMSATPHKQKVTYPIIFGINEYVLSWEEAISKKYICDYKFYYPNPEMVETKITELKQSSVISQLEITKCILLNKAYYLLECIKEFNVKKTIVFLKSISESHEFNKILSVLNVFFDNRLLVNEINCNTSKTERQKILSRFKNKNETINILCNVHILDEGIDIPECDSVYLTHPNYNPINFIQRISRCNRIKPVESGIANVANVFIWAKDDMKVDAIDKLIYDYLIPNTINTNNIYIRNTKNIENSMQNTTSTQNNNIVNNINNFQNEIIELIPDCSLLEYIINNSNIPVEFINDFIILYDKNIQKTINTVFVIDLDIAAKWLESYKRNLKTTLSESYKLDVDYTVKKVITTEKGRPNEKILLSPECFKRLCMLSRTEKAEEVRSYFIAVEQNLDKYKNYIIEGLNKKIKKYESELKPAPAPTTSGAIYVLKTSEDIDGVYKIGRTKNFAERIKVHQSSHPDKIEIVHVYETNNIEVVESCLKDLLKEKSYRKRKEFYEIDINLLKQLIKNCDCMHLAVRSKTKRLSNESCRYVLHVYKDKNANKEIKTSEPSTKAKK